MITINELQVENLKRIKAVKLEPSASGLTVIGGKNGQGKTSVLDAKIDRSYQPCQTFELEEGK